MRIIEVGTGYTPIPAKIGAATEIVVEELARSFCRHGLKVTVADIATLERGETDLPILEVSVPPFFTSTDVQLGLMHKAKRVVYSAALAGTLKKILRSHREKMVLHFHNQYNMFFFLMFSTRQIRKNCLLAYTNHSYIWHGNWKDICGTVRRKYFQEVCCMRHADRVYVLNSHTEHNIIEHLGIPRERIIRIDNGVNTERYAPISLARREQAFRHWGLAGRKIFLLVGSVCKRKNQLQAIKLLEPLMMKDPNIVFVYAGGIIEKEYQDSIMEYAYKRYIQKQVLYMGELEPGEELNSLYNMAAAMVFPSCSEGFSLVILEAMSAGLPVIIPDSLEFRLADECLRYRDPQSFEELVRNCILDDTCRKELSERMRSLVVREYGWDRIAAAYFHSWKG